jgi:hypothetical protein
VGYLRIESPALYGFLRKAYRARIWCSGYQRVDFGAKVLVRMFSKVSSSAGGEKNTGESPRSSVGKNGEGECADKMVAHPCRLRICSNRTI